MIDTGSIGELQGLDGWITLGKYCELTGEKKTAVHMRVYAGKWQRGVHYSSPDGGTPFVNVKAVLEWVRGSSEEAPPAGE